MLEEVFRSVLCVSRGEEQPTREDLVRNFQVLQRSRIKYGEEAYVKLYAYVKDHYDGYHEMPDFALAESHFKNIEGDHEVLAVLSKVRAQKPWIGSNYRKVLENIRNQQNETEFNEILNKGMEILTSGVKEAKTKERIKGLKPAVDFVNTSSRELLRLQEDFKLESQIRSAEDIKEVKESYDATENNAVDSIGIYSGLKVMDRRQGLKHTELMLVAAFTGQFKTTFTMNMAYRAIISGFNVAFVSLEMGHEEMRTKFYVLHTCNPKFLATAYAGLVGKIEVNKVLYRTLTKEEKEFYYFAMDDFLQEEDYGHLFIWQPDSSETTIQDIGTKFIEFDTELRNEGRQLEFGCIDYLTLLSPERGKRHKDPNEALNEVIKQTKRLCLTFNNGQGLRIISPFQTNRHGYESAKNDKGKYDLTALSNAHEAERSADLVIALYVGEEQREKDNIFFSCLKDRRNKPFKHFNAAVTAKSGFIYDIADKADQEFTEVDMAKLRQDMG